MYNNIFQNSIQEEIFVVGFNTIWWCYIEGLKEGGAQLQTNYNVELWSMKRVGCTYNHKLLEDGAYITSNMECWFCPIWWKGKWIELQAKPYDFGAMISKSWLGDEEMSSETYIHMEGERDYWARTDN